MLRGVPTADHIPEVHCLLEHGKVSGEDKVTGGRTIFRRGVFFLNESNL